MDTEDRHAISSIPWRLVWEITLPNDLLTVTQHIAANGSLAAIRAGSVAIAHAYPDISRRLVRVEPESSR